MNPDLLYEAATEIANLSDDGNPVRVRLLEAAKETNGTESAQLSDLDKLVLDSVRAGIGEAVKSKLGGYNSPLDKVVADVVSRQGAGLQSMLVRAVESTIQDEAFREEIRQAVRAKLARVLVDRFGGELEKQVNALKSDPSTRARITLAIDQIVKDKA